ncbi:MBL fold metallo-hydrolase [Pimelobacter simplex]|uniref:MBL fold metallo-hydrolase n=1 Tax=Nocardioides simplex TaxID=2045 RepID=UPI003AAA414C
MSARVDHTVTSGTFTLDGETFDVDNNVWVIGDDAECVVIDAPHHVADILALVGNRTVTAIICTHAHDDHVRVAPALRTATGAPLWLHPDDRPLWELTHGTDPDAVWDHDLRHGQEITVAGTTLQVLHTPGHAPGAVCLYAPDLGCVFTGDTLFHGGPGATGRSYSDRPTLEASIEEHLYRLPPDTVVHTGHGADTTIALERAHRAAALIRQRISARLPGEECVP